MKERIVKFIESEKITAAEFADRIGVQRSNVSHVLHGRNNPGFTFIQKILEAFPAINSRWLLTGDGNIYENEATPRKSIQQEPKLFSTSDIDVIAPKKIEKNKQTYNVEESLKEVDGVTSNSAVPPIDQPKKVTRVLIFYEDQTFEDFLPAK